MYADIIKAIELNHTYFKSPLFKNFKKKYIDNVKKTNPGNLLSGQIDRDLNVGDKKITNDNNCNDSNLILSKTNLRQL
tara:strand:+ start:335 stop:568 length:234 start_codon:yes stop_codon:yes gene_type:complete